MEHEMKKLLHQIGIPGAASIALLAAALAFSSFVVKPLEERSRLLNERASRQAPRIQDGGSGEKVAAVYQFLQKEEETTDWLAKLHGIGVATGVQLKSASYRTQKTEGRIVRYEIVLPVAGSYTQIRDFLKRSLAEIPVLSLDQLTLKREPRSDGAIQAEMRLTLHMVKS
jgi:Tfp pilus assembly protein PilO